MSRAPNGADAMTSRNGNGLGSDVFGPGSDVFVFVGPTLRPEEITAVLPQAIVRPPAALGDVYRALRHGPSAIALIDGFFETVPAVWHKELLWAMHHGVPVFGASSMGALRAAELDQFGMIGIGSIYQGFADGTLEDDDEVTVAHLDAESGFRSVSDAMVAFRATADAGVASGELSGGEAGAIVATAKRRFYPERRWDLVLDDLVKGDFFDRERADEILAWLASGGAVDAKADDARELLEHLARWERQGSHRPARDWDFGHTMYWAKAMGDLQDERTSDEGPQLDRIADRVLDELRLDPVTYRDTLEEAFTRRLASAVANTRGLNLRPEETQAALDRLRIELGLETPEDVKRWMADQKMSRHDLHELVRGEAGIDWARSFVSTGMDQSTLEVLRRRGTYGSLADAARNKREVLAEGGVDHALAGDGVGDETVLSWWFEEVADDNLPEDLDAYIYREKLGGRARFMRSIRREYWFQRLSKVTD